MPTWLKAERFRHGRKKVLVQNRLLVYHNPPACAGLPKRAKDDEDKERWKGKWRLDL